MNVSYATMEAMGMLVKRLGQDARRLEKALAETMNASAEWKRIAEEMKKERNALRAATIDTAAGSLLDAFGSLANEPRHGATDDAYRDRIVTTLHTIQLERDALRADVKDLRTLCGQWKQRETELQAEIERLKKPERKHPVAVGEWVRRTGNFCHWGRSGEVAQVQGIRGSSYRVQRQCGDVTDWDIVFCEPCDPPEATHDTAEGRSVSESVIRDDRKTEPKPGDVVRLVSVPTADEYPHNTGRWEPNWGGIGDYMRVHHIGNNINGTRIVRAAFGLEWPISCIEIVEDAK